MVKDAIKDVVSGSVTYAVRATSIDGFKLKEGDIIGLGEKNIIAKGEDVNKTTLTTIEKLMKDNAATLTLFYGNDVSQETADKLVETLSEKYPNIEVECHSGGQPLYYYLISIE